MRIADRHIEWDARSVLTWQYDKAVNMIAFLSLWQKWIDINCSQLFYGCASRIITRDNAVANGYTSLSKDFFMTDATDVVKSFTTVSGIKDTLIPIAQNWKNTDTKNEQSDAKSGTKLIETNGREMVNHIGDTFKMRVKKLFKYSVGDDGTLTKEWVNCSEDETYAVRPSTEEYTPHDVTKREACGSVSGTNYWFETEYEYTYATWNGEQWVECPTYNNEYSGGWFADIFAIDTCNEFGLLLWAKLIGVELPNLYGTESTKTVANTDEQNEVWRTYIKARFYRLLTNGSMNDIVQYLHYVFAQFDNHEILVTDGGSYELGTVNGDVFNEAYNTETDASGSVRSGYVCTIVEVDPNDAKHEGWDVTDRTLDTFRNIETIIKVGYKVYVTNVDDTSSFDEKTVVGTGIDCITATHDEHGTKTVPNKVKVKFLEDWKEGYTIVSVGDTEMTVKDGAGTESQTVKSVCVLDDDSGEWVEGYYAHAVKDANTITVMDGIGETHDVAQDHIKVHFYGDWKEGYTVEEVVSSAYIVVKDADGEFETTVNSVQLYNESTEEYDADYVVDSVDHSSFMVQDANGVRSYTENQYVKMVPYDDIEYYGVKLMTISYSCEFDQNTTERAILNISDFLPHPSAVLSENTMFAGEDIAFGFNSHNFLANCIPYVVKGDDNKGYYVYPYQDPDASDCDVPKKLKIVGSRTTSKSYLEDKETLTESLRASKTIGAWDNIFLCHVVNANGSRGTAKWAVGTEWDGHIVDSKDTDPETVSKFIGQTSLYRYKADGTVMTGLVMTPVIYDALIADTKLSGYIRKVDGAAKKYYDGKYDPTDVDPTKWKALTATTTGGVTKYSYQYKNGWETETQTYEIEFDEQGEPLYVNRENRCYASYEEAQNAICRIESYNAENGDYTPLPIAQNQNIANTQTVSYGGDFFSRYLILKTLALANVTWKEFNLFGRKEIDPKNGGYFKGGQESTPVGLTEIVRVLMGNDTVARRFELWHKSYVQRMGVMMQEVDSLKVFAQSDTSENRYYHTTEFDKDGKFVPSTNISASNRLKTTEFLGMKIKYTRPDRTRRTVETPEFAARHPLNELFVLEDGTVYTQAPESGTYIIDFKYEERYVKEDGTVTTTKPTSGNYVTDHVFKGVRFIYKLKKNETDDDTTLPWATRLAKYERLKMSDVGLEGGTWLQNGKFAMMPTCDYGFMKYNFKSVTESEELLTPNVLYYYGFGNITGGGNTYGGKAIPTPSGSAEDQPYEKELALIELWGQNNLETMNNGGLSST